MITQGRKLRLRRAPRLRLKEISLHMAVADFLRRFARLAANDSDEEEAAALFAEAAGRNRGTP
jgi:hypothetical protein